MMCNLTPSASHNLINCNYRGGIPRRRSVINDESLLLFHKKSENSRSKKIIVTCTRVKLDKQSHKFSCIRVCLTFACGKQTLFNLSLNLIPCLRHSLPPQSCVSLNISDSNKIIDFKHFSINFTSFGICSSARPHLIN